eukprot:3529452-Rhodomonas_salina.2
MHLVASLFSRSAGEAVEVVGREVLVDELARDVAGSTTALRQYQQPSYHSAASVPAGYHASRQ